MPHHDAHRVLSAVGPRRATDLLRQALIAGLDPAAAPPRSSTALGGGELLTMPAAVGDRAGVKLAFVAPGNAALGLPRITGVYVLLDAATLVPLATLDAPSLTRLRTPATSLLAVQSVLAGRPGRPGSTRSPLRAVVVGSGVQAQGHVAALLACLGPGTPVERAVGHLDVLVRDPARVGPTGELVGDADGDLLALGSPAAREALAAADVVVCATSAGEPLFDSSVLREDVVVVAVGTHEPDRRELDAALLARAAVVVEDRATALREAGDVVMAIAEGALEEGDLLPLADLVTGRAPVPSGAVVFKGTGMAWQDLVVASAVHDAVSSRPGP
ncbi:ornithine cyclodeaminase family protein [Quadrisphaera sp. RL12-1S]|nr:ornithine cyclodeaminase family protein [Quadrisphaera sp. RL12-1S]